jgi:chromosome segregation ATPase
MGTDPEVSDPMLANTLRLSFLVPLALGCASSPRSDVPRRETTPETPGSPAASGWSGSKLYARDGTVVEDAGAPAQDGPGGSASPRELAPSEGGRMYLLELYQAAIDERDTLEVELRAVQAELALARETLLGSERSASELQAEIARLTAESRRLVDENLDLAARLTTAQIRRLQVEKVLLETRIAETAAANAADPERRR